MKMYKVVAAIPVAMLLMGSAQVLAAPSYATSLGSSPPPIGSMVTTPSGVGVVTGSFGSTAITSLPDAGGVGLLMNNGNGTSTLVAPGGASQTFATPR
jgi:hypothetical protein